MKRIISAILIAVLISGLASLFAFGVTAEAGLDVSLKLPETFEPGETVELTLTLNKLPKDFLFAVVNIEFTGLEFTLKGKNQVADVAIKNSDSKVLDFCIIDDEGRLSFTFNGVDSSINGGTVFTVKAKAKSNAKNVTVSIDTASSEVFAGASKLTVSAASAKSELKPGAEVVIDVDTTDWTYVDGKTNGTWQNALDPDDPEAVGTYYYRANKEYRYNSDILGGAGFKYVIEILFKGELTGTPEAFGEGNGTNIRIWFHSAKNVTGADQLAYNTVLDLAYNGSDIVSRLAINSHTEDNKPNWVIGYDAEKPYTVESVIPTAKDGLYLKISFSGIMNIVDDSDVEAVITASNKPSGKSNNALDSNRHDAGVGPWTTDTWTDSATTIHFYSEEGPYEPSSEAAENSEVLSSESAASDIPSDEQSQAVSFADSSEATYESNGSTPIIIVFVVFLVLVGAIVAFAVKKFR